VFITGQSDEEVRPRALAAGAVDYLHKPFHEAALIRAVNAAVGVSR
jgi:FixJ family two-component response regulator